MFKRILESTYPFEQLSIPNPDYYSDYLPATSEDITKIVGRKFPFVVIDGQVIKPIHISMLNISYGYNQLPVLEMIIKDTTGTYHNVFAGNNQIISVFIQGANDDMFIRSDFIVTSIDSVKMKTNTNTDYNRYGHASTYHVLARLNVVGLYSTIYSVLDRNLVTSYEMICNELMMGLVAYGDVIHDLMSDNPIVIYKTKPLYKWLFDLPTIVYDDFYLVGISPNLDISLILYDDMKNQTKGESQLFSQFYDLIYDIQQGMESTYDVQSRFVFTNWEGVENTHFYIHKWEIISDDRTKYIESIQDLTIYRYHVADTKDIAIGYGNNNDNSNENIIPIKHNFAYDFGQPTPEYIFNKYNSLFRSNMFMNNKQIKISTSIYTGIHIGQIIEVYIIDYTDTQPQNTQDLEPTSDFDSTPKLNENISGLYCVINVEIEYKQSRRDRQSPYITHITAIRIN